MKGFYGGPGGESIRCACSQGAATICKMVPILLRSRRCETGGDDRSYRCRIAKTMLKDNRTRDCTHESIKHLRSAHVAGYVASHLGWDSKVAEGSARPQSILGKVEMKGGRHEDQVPARHMYVVSPCTQVISAEKRGGARLGKTNGVGEYKRFSDGLRSRNRSTITGWCSHNS